MAQPHRPSTDEMTIREEIAESWPFFVLVTLVLAGGYVTALFSQRALHQPLRLTIFTVLVLLHGGLYWLVGYTIRHRRWLLVYFVVQGALAFTIGLLAPGHWLTIAVHLALAGLMIGALWPNVRASILAALISFALLALNLGLSSWDVQALVGFLPIAGFMLLFVFIYVTLLVRQVEAHERTQKLLRELEIAHQRLQEYANQVEELTLSQERERMARELHDTLAQGVAGLILQLEAADGHLEQGNSARAHAVVQQAMQRARTTLDEARRAIQALRPAVLEEGDLVDALRREVDQFTATTGTPATLDIDGSLPELAADGAQNVLRIVQESLTNVARHADASHVLVRLAERDGFLQVMIQDDGVGFDPDGAQGRPDKFGLAGMEERAQRIGGVLQVESAAGEGTTVTLQVKGEAQ
jgi:NarL family two-component system sensor histidine kinase YdfH